MPPSRFSRWCRVHAQLVVALAFAPIGCVSPEYIAGGIAASALVGGYSPTQEIEQTYYLGSFDPQGQLPAEFYRITVRGQASLISRMRFGSGWVKADLVDSLGTRLSFDDNGEMKLSRAGTDLDGSIETGRRLIQFGPEGFRESPADHRLVIVMGTSPEAFFQAVDESLGVISKVQQEQRDSSVAGAIFQEHLRISHQLERLHEVELDVMTDRANSTAAAAAAAGDSP